MYVNPSSHRFPASLIICRKMRKSRYSKEARGATRSAHGAHVSLLVVTVTYTCGGGVSEAKIFLRT